MDLTEAKETVKKYKDSDSYIDDLNSYREDVLPTQVNPMKKDFRKFTNAWQFTMLCTYIDSLEARITALEA